MPDVSQRLLLIEEARTWLGTPYHKRGLIKGAGCDCYSFVILCLQSIGLALDNDFPVHGDDWWTNCTDQEYFKRIMKFASEKVRGTGLWGTLTEAQPGDIALVRCNRQSQIFNHGGIVVDWPRIIQCGDRVREVSVWQDPLWRGHEIVIFDPFQMVTTNGA